MSTGWRTWEPTTQDPNVHVTPEDDVVAHSLNAYCICGPRLELVDRADGTHGRMLVHHSLDNREAREVAR